MRLDFCALCGCNDPTALEHHHFIPKIYGGTDDEWNIFTVCGICHGRIHDIPRPLRLRELNKAGRDRAKNNLHSHIRSKNRTIGSRIRVLTKLAESLGRSDLVHEALKQSKNETIAVNYEKVLIDIQRVFDRNGRIITSATMLSELLGLEDPAHNWFEFRRPLTKNLLAQFLHSSFNINNRLHRIQQKVCRVYMRDDFEVEWNRYRLLDSAMIN